MASQHYNLNHRTKASPSSTFKYIPSINNNSPTYAITGVMNSTRSPLLNSLSSSSTGPQYATTINLKNINNNNFTNEDIFSLTSSSVTDNAESECLEHYESNLEKYKGKLYKIFIVKNFLRY